MASNDGHFIQRFKFDFEVENREKAKKTQDELSRIFQFKLQGILEEVLDEFQVEGHLLRIKYLELDLGDLSEAYFESDLIDRFRAVLRKELAEIRGKATYPSSYYHRNEELIPLWPAKLEVVAYFLEFGRLPINAARFPQRVDEILRDLIKEIPQEVRKSLRELIHKNSYVSLRLVEQFSEEVLEEVFRVFNDSYFVFVQREYRALAEQIHIEYGLDRRKVEKILLEASLVHLVKTENRPFSRIGFFRMVRRFAERRTNQDLGLVFPEEGAETGRKEELDQRYAPFIRLVQQALAGELNSDQKAGLVKAFEVLIRFHFEALTEIVQEEKNDRQVFLNLIQILPTESIQRYIQSASPAKGKEILRIALRAIAAHSRFLKGRASDTQFRNETYTALLQYVSKTPSRSQSDHSFSEFLKENLKNEQEIPKELIERWSAIVEEGIEIPLDPETETKKEENIETQPEDLVDQTDIEEIAERGPEESLDVDKDKRKEKSSETERDIEEALPEEKEEVQPPKDEVSTGEEEITPEESEKDEGPVEEDISEKEPIEQDSEEVSETEPESLDEAEFPEVDESLDVEEVEEPQKDEEKTVEVPEDVEVLEPDESGMDEVEDVVEPEEPEERAGDTDLEPEEEAEEKSKQVDDGIEEQSEDETEVETDTGDQEELVEDGEDGVLDKEDREESTQSEEAISETGESDETEPGLPEEIEPENIKGDSERTRTDFVLHILETGEIPWWSKNLIEPDPVRAFTSLIEEESSLFLVEFGRKVAEASVSEKSLIATRLLEMFGATAAQSILKQVVPDIFGLYVTVSMVIDRYQKTADLSILSQSLQNPNTFKWYPIVRFFLDHIDNPPGPAQLIRYVIRMLAASTGQEVQNVIAGIRKVVSDAMKIGEMRFLPFQTLLPAIDEDVVLESEEAEASVKLEEEIVEALMNEISEESEGIEQEEQDQKDVGDSNEFPGGDEVDAQIELESDPDQLGEKYEKDTESDKEADKEGVPDNEAEDSPELPANLTQEESPEVLSDKDDSDVKDQRSDQVETEAEIDIEGIIETASDNDETVEDDNEDSLEEDLQLPDEARDSQEYEAESPSLEDATEELKGQDLDEQEADKENLTGEEDPIGDERITEDTGGLEEETLEKEDLTDEGDSLPELEIEEDGIDEVHDSEIGRHESEEVEEDESDTEEIERETESRETEQEEVDLLDSKSALEQEADEGDISEALTEDSSAPDLTEEEVEKPARDEESSGDLPEREDKESDSDEEVPTQKEVEEEVQSILEESEITPEEVVIYYLRTGSLPPQVGTLSEPAVWLMIQEMVATNPERIEQVLRDQVGSSALAKRIANLPTPIFDSIIRLLLPKTQEEQFVRFFFEIKKLFASGTAPVPPLEIGMHAFRYLAGLVETSMRLEEYIYDLVDFLEDSTHLPKLKLVDWMLDASRHNPSLISVTLEEILASIKGDMEPPIDELSENEPDYREVDDPELPIPVEEGVEEEPEIYINNAGLVLFVPMLSRAFKNLEYLDVQGRFKSEQLKERAIYFLAYLSHKDEEIPEEDLVLNKLMTGWELNTPVQAGITLTDEEKKIAEGMIDEMRSKWTGMDKTKNETMRTSWYQRAGRLSADKYSTWVLRVDQKAYDLLLSRLAYSVPFFDGSWTSTTIRVEWQ